MNVKKYGKYIAIVVSIGLVALGCQTYGQAGGLGAAIGAGTGALIGSHSGHAWEGALIGGAVGGIAGLIAHDIKVRQMRTAQETAAKYNYQPAQGIMVRPEAAYATPQSIKPGQSVRTSVQYAVMGAGANGITITETRTLRQNGQVLKQVSSKDVMRTDGTWESTQEISFPANTPPGSYEIAQDVKAPNAQFQQNVSFLVAQ